MKSTIYNYQKNCVQSINKIINLALILFGLFSISSCTEEEQVDNDTISKVYETTRSFTDANNFSNLIVLPQPIFNSDMILVYRLSGVSGGTDVWKIQPETYFFNDGTLDFGYDFNFTQYDVELFMHGNDLGTVASNLRLNQVFRIVIVPGYFGKNTNPSLDINDYHAVIKSYNIDESKKIVLK